MRKVLLSSVVLIFSLAPNLGHAGPRQAQAEPSNTGAPAAQVPAYEKYRGYVFDLSENSERRDVVAIADTFRRQIDVVENVGLSPKVLQFFHTVPIVASEMACLDEGAAAACYGLSMPDRNRHPRGVTTWDHAKLQWTNPDVIDLAIDSGLGVVMVRPTMMKFAQEPVMLHEFLHVFHSRLMPNGFENKGIKDYYAEAKRKDLYGKETYVIKNNREFFAVTASIFLAGKDSAHEPFTREKLKQIQPDYYGYLAGVFGFDPDAPAITPVASAN